MKKMKILNSQLLQKFKRIIREEVNNQLSLNEALNKDLRDFGKDIAKRLKSAGFDVGFLDGRAISGSGFGKVADTIRKNPKSIGISYQQTGWPDQDQLQELAVYASPKVKKSVVKVLKQFQVPAIGGDVEPETFRKSGKKYSTKMNDGDIYSAYPVETENKPNSETLGWYFYRKVAK